MTIDTEITLDMLRVQLLQLEHEMYALRQLVEQIHVSQSPPRDTFKSLAGVWQSVVVNDDDFESAHLTFSKDI